MNQPAISTTVVAKQTKLQNTNWLNTPVAFNGNNITSEVVTNLLDQSSAHLTFCIYALTLQALSYEYNNRQ